MFSLFLLNTEKYTINTIKHEFIHWIQFNLNKLSANINDHKNKLTEVKFLKLTEDEYDYVFQANEFYPIVYDLCYGLEKLYKIKYSHLSVNEFLDLVFKICLSNDSKIVDSDLFLNYGIVNQDDLPIRIFIANNILNKKDNRIEKIITSYFRKLKINDTNK